MNIVFDNIIYTLQRNGGISVVWNELLKRARVDHDLQCVELDYRQSIQPRFMERYRVPEYRPQTPCIFHSSYFRTLPQDGVYNVTTVHDLTYHYYRSGLAKAVHLWEEKCALHNSDAIICVSENTKRDLLRLYPWIEENRLYVVYNGVGDEFYPIPSVEKKGYLLYIGNGQATYKRYDVAQEVSRLTGIELVTVSNVSRAELNRLYNEALCLLYPSDYEGFGLPILEAQKAGCPVVAQRFSSIPEVMGDGGLMVAHDTPQHVAQEMAGAVRQLCSCSTQAIIEKGKQNAARFSWENTYKQTKKVYEDIYHNHNI
ncbi:MAG: glycosyltransferase family 4 protein [Paludibacteraceae bacterium]|nr:glycosyltransferase family 4 protein [Paludibacteraceae bacterium]